MDTDTDILTVRAQLKAFERDFKATHHRTPSVDDIKNAGFADKYKLYKRLSKLGNATRSLPENSHQPPSTPPRSAVRKSEIPISIIPRSRAVNTETSSTSNPFSPSKNKHKQLAPFSPSGSDGPANPFATPQKAKQSLIYSSPKSLSPDPFPPIQALTGSPPRTSVPSSTVFRARKRLRGEPVSPSPVKEKRQRVLPDPLPFANLNRLAAEDSDDCSDDDRTDAAQADSSFVADSPMKPPPKGGAFKLLFEGAAGDAISLDGRARSQGVPVNAGLGIPRSKSQRAGSMSWSSASKMLPDNHENPKMKASEGNSTKESVKPRTAKRFYPTPSGNNKFFGAAQPSEVPPSQAEPEQAKQTDHIEENVQGITAVKRSLADIDSDARDTLRPDHRPLLLPPSPPPAASSSVYTGKGKGGGKVTGPTRKRPKLPEDSGDEEEGSIDLHVKIREWSWQRRDTIRDADKSVEDLDPILCLAAYDRPSSPGGASGDVPGDVEVSLPDDLRRLLAISPSKAHSTREVSMVRSVLYGERPGGYDALRGGDIWNVGEIGEASDSQAEDDWEGEPVPWETGEL